MSRNAVTVYACPCGRSSSTLICDAGHPKPAAAPGPPCEHCNGVLTPVRPALTAASVASQPEEGGDIGGVREGFIKACGEPMVARDLTPATIWRKIKLFDPRAAHDPRVVNTLKPRLCAQNVDVLSRDQWLRAGFTGAQVDACAAEASRRAARAAPLHRALAATARRTRANPACWP